MQINPPAGGILIRKNASARVVNNFIKSYLFFHGECNQQELQACDPQKRRRIFCFQNNGYRVLVPGK